ncbi:hypothetical protein B0T22DRAFT_139912 [Podospora appendiculata]|uniref:Uncharacterized protein n=1 Tax=Podospora appendiculata TaxID=314037 RepID=A0AAE0X8I9_9PEZI|nr:hypothetical protein B0T22DRAFT_139912 [Podospora appendiculata]
MMGITHPRGRSNRQVALSRACPLPVAWRSEPITLNKSAISWHSVSQRGQLQLIFISSVALGCFDPTVFKPNRPPTQGFGEQNPASRSSDNDRPPYCRVLERSADRGSVLDGSNASRGCQTAKVSDSTEMQIKSRPCSVSWGFLIAPPQTRCPPGATGIPIRVSRYKSRIPLLDIQPVVRAPANSETAWFWNCADRMPDPVVTDHLLQGASRCHRIHAKISIAL